MKHISFPKVKTEKRATTYTTASPMSNDKTAEEIERELIKKEALEKYPCVAGNGLSFTDYNAPQRFAYINGIITQRERSAQQLKEYKEVIRELLPLAEIGLTWYPRKAVVIDRAKKLLDK